jgi:hypothetical protein
MARGFVCAVSPERTARPYGYPSHNKSGIECVKDQREDGDLWTSAKYLVIGPVSRRRYSLGSSKRVTMA